MTGAYSPSPTDGGQGKSQAKVGRGLIALVLHYAEEQSAIRCFPPPESGTCPSVEEA